LTAFNATPIYLPFVKIEHLLAMGEFCGYDFAKLNALRDHRDITSTTKQRQQRLIPFLLTFI
jgi:hypothetical protein